MAGLGQTNDPQALITGDPGSVYETEAQLRQYGDVLLEAGAGLRRIDTADGWRGVAADAFRKVYDSQPTRWLRAGDAFHSTVTDIDRIQDGTLWEEKTATGQDPRMNVQSWVQKNVAGKLDSYLRARQYLPGYEQAPLGLDFTQPGATSAFRAAVEQAVDQWKTTNPGVDVTVRWAP